MSTVQDLGERKIIDLIVSKLEKLPGMPVPFGDDVTAVPLDRGRLAVLKTDMLIGSLDVPPGMSLYRIARKAVVMSISDFAAKGVKPTALLASLGFPRSFTDIDVEALAEGLNAGAREYGAYLIGGDTSEAPDLIIACMVYGTAKSKSLILRSGARSDDVLAVTGSFGGTAAGLRLLLDNLDTPQPLREKLLDSVYLPKARLREGITLAKTGVVTSSIDSSDGLAVSLHELRKMSRTGFEVTTLPLAEEARDFAELHGLDPRDLVLYGGEEYELVVTICPEGWQKAQEAVESVEGSLIKIGVVTERPSISLREDNQRSEIPYRGWEHFKSHP